MLKRLVATTIVGATVLAGTVVTGARVAGAATTTSCPTGTWPSSVEGRPPAAKVGMTGVALWHDSHGWHLRASEAGADKAVFAGTVSTDGLLVSVRRHLEGGDITLSPGPHRVGYRFTNYGGVDGIDFAALCASTIRVTAYMNGRLVPVSHIVIGAGNTHPSSQPIVIHKVAS
jgi:hypothetical protein